MGCCQSANAAAVELSANTSMPAVDAPLKEEAPMKKPAEEPASLSAKVLVGLPAKPAPPPAKVENAEEP